jgi:hypothetical protein
MSSVETLSTNLHDHRGYTTAHAIKIFDKVFPSPQIANVRLMVGSSSTCEYYHFHNR